MTIYTQIDENKNKSLLIMVIFVALISLLAFVFDKVGGFGYGLLLPALAFSTVSAVGGYFYSDKIVLAISGAKLVAEKNNPELYRLVENICIAAGLPKPKIYTIDDSAPNAFATGRDPNHASICFTTGILSKLNRLELEGVVAHELSHIKNYDIRFMSVVTVMVGMVTLLSDWYLRSFWYRPRRRDEKESGNIGVVMLIIAIVLAVISPVFAMLVQLAISRKRELLADASGVLLTRYPEGLAAALEKIASDKEPLEAANRATAPLYIVNPFKGEPFKGFLTSLLNTHPPVGERISILRSM